MEEGPVAHRSFPSGGILLQQPDRRQEISLSFKKEDMRIVIRRSEWVEGQKVNGRTSVRQNFESRCNKQLLFKGTGREKRPGTRYCVCPTLPGKLFAGKGEPRTTLLGSLLQTQSCVIFITIVLQISLLLVLSQTDTHEMTFSV